MKLQNKVVLITGAKGGLGTFVTNAFLAEGARVVGASRSIVDADFPHANFSAIAAGVASGEDARVLVEAVLTKWGRIDVLVHLVGGFAGGKSIADTDDAALDKMLDLNFRSAFYLMRAVAPGMRGRGSGRILAIGSKAGVEPSPMAAAYGASKAALVSLVRSMARENSDLGISANVVLPGTMDTPANRGADPGADFSRWVHPDQIAGLLVYLASDAASQVNGAVIPVAGRDA